MIGLGLRSEVTPRPSTRRHSMITLTWIARTIGLRMGVATVLLWAGSEWRCVRFGSNTDNSGVELQLGRIAWWTYVDPDTIQFVITKWMLDGLLRIGPRVEQP